MHTDFPEGYCIFQPFVQVLDNWGWCNGTCKDNNPNTNDAQDTSPGGVGCYHYNDSDDKKSINECENFKSTPLLGAYTPFKYKVLVAPNKIQQPIQ